MADEDEEDEYEEVIDDEPLTVEHVAKWLLVSPSTVYKLLRSGVLPSFKVGARRLVSTDDLRAFVARQKAAEAAKSEAEKPALPKPAEPLRIPRPPKLKKAGELTPGQRFLREFDGR